VGTSNYDVDCGHLNYLRHEEVHRMCEALVHRVAADSVVVA
jgi:hypothetical protein